MWSKVPNPNAHRVPIVLHKATCGTGALLALYILEVQNHGKA